MKRLLAFLVVAAVLVIVPGSAVLADQSYHTERLPLAITDAGSDAGHTLRQGMVVNAHPNGPVNGAVEQYVLNGAKPNTEYSVWWDVQGVGVLPTTTGGTTSPLVVVTDSKGNGHFTARISHAYMLSQGLHNLNLTLRWLFKAGNTVVFETEFTDVHIDSPSPLSPWPIRAAA